MMLLILWSDSACNSVLCCLDIHRPAGCTKEVANPIHRNNATNEKNAIFCPVPLLVVVIMK
jgi:hypothetical protein